MGLIRAATVQDSAVVKLSLRDIEAEARQVIDRAKAEAAEIVAHATRRAAELEADAVNVAKEDGFKQGYEEGFAKGHADGLTESAERVGQITSALSEATRRIDSSRIELENSVAGDLAQLAIGIAERITKRFGRIDPQVLAENLREVLKLIIHREDVRIAIHPSQRATLTELMPKLQIEWTGLSEAAIVEDGSIAPGGCRVFAGQGEIDADLQTQLDRIAAAIIPDPSEAQT